MKAKGSKNCSITIADTVLLLLLLKILRTQIGT